MDEVTFTLTWSKEEGGGGCRSVCQSAAVALCFSPDEGKKKVDLGFQPGTRRRIESEWKRRGREAGRGGK